MSDEITFGYLPSKSLYAIVYKPDGDVRTVRGAMTEHNEGLNSYYRKNDGTIQANDFVMIDDNVRTVGQGPYQPEVGSVSDKTGFSLSTAGILAIWHQLTVAVVTASTMGKLIVDYLNASITSRAPAGEYDTELDANISTRATSGDITTAHTATDSDIADVKAETVLIVEDTNELQTNQGNWLTAVGFSTHAAADIWSVGSRTLTSFGTLVADITLAIWGAVTRTLTAGTKDTEIDNIKTVTDKLGDTVEDDGGYIFTVAALAQAPSGTGSTPDAFVAALKSSDGWLTNIGSGTLSYKQIITILTAWAVGKVEDDGSGNYSVLDPEDDNTVIFKLTTVSQTTPYKDTNIG